jgi:hypothetical protein
MTHGESDINLRSCVTKAPSLLGINSVRFRSLPGAAVMEMAEKSHERRAIVIGGSIASLFVGAFLRRIGWQVDIYERSSIELIGRGVGIFATHLELLEALDKCGAGTVDIGVIVYKRITFDRRGDVIAEKPQLQIVTSWDRLRQVLLRASDCQRYHFGYVFERVEQDGSGVQVYFANGRTDSIADWRGSGQGLAALRDFTADTTSCTIAAFTRKRPARKPFPEHLPRERLIMSVFRHGIPPVSVGGYLMACELLLPAFWQPAVS